MTRLLPARKSTVKQKITLPGFGARSSAEAHLAIGLVYANPLNIISPNISRKDCFCSEKYTLRSKVCFQPISEPLHKLRVDRIL